jgi:nicotinamidase-related amidase
MKEAHMPNRALIVIDVQNEYFTGQMKIAYPPVSTTLPNITAAMRAAKAAGIPVVVVRHDAPQASPIFAQGSQTWQLHPEVAAFPADLLLPKTKASAFEGTELREWLAARGVDTITVVGYMTQNCCAATIYQAGDLKAEFLADAAGAPSYENEAGKVSAEEIHRTYCTIFHSNFAAVASTEAWLTAVQEGRALGTDNIYLSVRRAA